MKNPVTITDLARELGVSDRAVSQALNPRESNVKLRPETVERIRSLALQRNYKPNAVARAMRSRKFLNIGYFEAKAHLGYSLYGADIGLSDAAVKHGYNITLVRLSSNSEDNLTMLPRVFKESHLDALVISNVATLTSSMQEVIDLLDLPIIYLNEKRQTNTVYVDDEDAAYNLTKHFIDRGYRRILFNHLDPDPTLIPHYHKEDRKKGYMRAMAEFNLEPMFMTRQPQSWIEDMLSLMRSSKRPDSILCIGSLYALRMFRAFHNTEFRVPEDVAIAGFGNDWFGLECPVPLTVMEIPFIEMGAEAAEMAIGLAAGRLTGRLPAKIFKARLIIRDTTPPIASKKIKKGARSSRSTRAG